MGTSAEIDIIVQPNRWSCMACCFAMAAGLTLDELMAIVDHDGSEILFPDLEEPYCRRGFNGQEMATTLIDSGYIISEYNFNPVGVVDDEHYFNLEYSDADKDSYIKRLLSRGPGVICCVVKTTGKHHAVVWDGNGRYLDPDGFIYPLDRYDVQMYYAFGCVSGTLAEEKLTARGGLFSVLKYF